MTRHLLDPYLFNEPDVGRTIAIFDRIQALNKERVQALREHRSDIIRALTHWAEEVFLPRHYDVTLSKYRTNENGIKPDTDLNHMDEPNQPIDLLLYGAVMILRYEPSYSKAKGMTFLELARQLGSGKAGRMLKEGSDTFAREDVHLRDELTECKANDVFSIITVVIRKEEAGAYERAISFILSLLRKGFPKSYKIKLKSSVREALPIKGLAKSDTHRFSRMHWPIPSCIRYWRNTLVRRWKSLCGTRIQKVRKASCQAVMPYSGWDSRTSAIFRW